MDKVYIKPEVHAEIMYHVHKSDIEVSGLGRVERTTTGELVVTKVYLLDQENTGASTDITEDAISKLMYETREDKGDLNFWWHSHVNMGVFWSGTDMDTIRQFGKNGYLLSTVFNKKGEHRTSYFQGDTNSFLPSVFVDEIPTSFAYLPTKEQVDSWKAEHEAKCKPKKPVWSGNLNWSSNGQAIGLGDDVPDMHDKVNEAGMRLGDFSGETWPNLLVALQETRDTYEHYSGLDMFQETYWWDFFCAYHGFDPFTCDQVEELFDKCNNMDFFYKALDFVKSKYITPKTAEVKKLQAKVNNTKKGKRRGRPRGSRNKKQYGLKAGNK